MRNFRWFVISKLIRNKPRPGQHYGVFTLKTPNVFHPHYAGEI